MAVIEEVDTKPIERKMFIKALREITEGLDNRLFSGRILSNADGTEITILLENGENLH